MNGVRVGMISAIPVQSETTGGNTANNRSGAGRGFTTAGYVLLTGLLSVGLVPAAWSSTTSRVAHAPSTQQSTSVLILRGLDKITGRSVEMIAPIGTPVQFETLRITARYCYSTPPSDIPETVAFLQIDDERPDQPPRRVFSGWMYASSPSLNALDHPLYDVWSVECRSSPPHDIPGAVASLAPPTAKPPDLTDGESLMPVPEVSGQ